MWSTMKNFCRLLWVVSSLTLTLAVAKSVTRGNHHDPELVLINKAGKSVERYHGELRAGDTVVELDPPLRATDKDEGESKYICGYTVEQTHKDKVHQVTFPFKVELRDHKTGEAEIVLARDVKLDVRAKPFYKFWVSAYDCGSPRRYSESAHVRVNIVEGVQHPPVFEQQSYTVSVQEGQVFDKILQVKARDQDLSPRDHDICRYKILTRDVPFVVDEEGNVKNTEKLAYSRQKMYKLSVVAQDCSGKVSKPISLTIKVMPSCQPGWNGIDERLEYTPNSGIYKMFRPAKLETCQAVCKVEKIQTKVSLQTSHIGKNCDRDTYSTETLRKRCGATKHSYDLLPSPDKPSSWTKNVPTDDGKMSDQIFAFDGKTTAVVVDEKRVNHTLGQHFTLTTWMKHEQDVNDDSQHGRKEQILCSSDADTMNRHHYSWFVHNCRLVLLVRQEPGAIDPETYKHAEWRWKLAQVCDGRWHHYAISFDFPKVRLYIDGVKYDDKANNPEILDDWALHKSRKVHGTKLVVGACWLGGTSKMNQHFQGYLAGTSLLKGSTEDDRVLKCLNRCQEQLDLTHAMSLMHSGMTAAFNSEMTEITISGVNAKEVTSLVREIGYVNTRLNPTPGRRNINIQTQFKCAGDDVLKVSDVSSYIMVLQSSEPVITVTGVPTLTVDQLQVEEGVVIFPDVSIVAQVKASEQDAEQETVPNKPHKLLSGLDECVVKVSPALQEYEDLIVPSNLAKQLGLDVDKSKDGVTVNGIDKVHGFEKFIRNLGYYTDRPKDFVGRRFRLQCSDQNGRFVSNEFRVQLDVLVRKPSAKPVVHVAHVQDHKQEVVVNKILPINPHELHLEEEGKEGQEGKVAGTSAGIITIIVVCVGFLAFMIVLGVVRIRAAHQRTQVVTVEEQQEMEWDDNWDNSTLNITVNPLENELQQEFEVDQLHNDDSDSDDDEGNSLARDDIESSEDESEKIKDRELEWDDSTLSF